jgi:hypothetical protein
LNLLDPLDELMLVGDIAAQRLHGGKGQAGLRGEKLANHARSMPSP